MKKLLYSFFAIYITCTAKAQDTVDIWNLPPLNVEQGRYTTTEGGRITEDGSTAVLVNKQSLS